MEELTFFGITPQMTVVELWPGGGYWTEILGPYLAKGGTYYVAQPAPAMPRKTRCRALAFAGGRAEGSFWHNS